MVGSILLHLMLICICCTSYCGIELKQMSQVGLMLRMVHIFMKSCGTRTCIYRWCGNLWMKHVVSMQNVTFALLLILLAISIIVFCFRHIFMPLQATRGRNYYVFAMSLCPDVPCQHQHFFRFLWMLNKFWWNVHEAVITTNRWTD